jgi:hypothetical protein
MSEIARVARLAAANGRPLAPVDASGQPSETDPATELTTLLALPSVGLSVTSAEMYGRGSSAIARINLSDGSCLELDPLGKYGSPAKLTIEVAITVGATPTLKASMVVRIMALLHQLSAHHESMSKRDLVASWGTDFLQAAERHAVDMANQEDRWRAFQLLAHTDPVARSRSEGTSIARQAIVLDAGDLLYVRCGWFLSYVRATVGPYASDDLARDMSSVGWTRPGGKGRIKTTSPSTAESLLWTFYTVPKNWGTDG